MISLLYLLISVITFGNVDLHGGDDYLEYEYNLDYAWNEKVQPFDMPISVPLEDISILASWNGSMEHYLIERGEGQTIQGTWCFDIMRHKTQGRDYVTINEDCYSGFVAEYADGFIDLDGFSDYHAEEQFNTLNM